MKRISFYDICGYVTVILLILGAFADSLSVFFLMPVPITMLFWAFGQCTPVQETKPAAALQKAESVEELKEIILYQESKPISGWLENVFGNLLLQVCESEMIKFKA